MVFYLSAEWFVTAYRLFGLRDSRSSLIVFCQILSKYFAFFEVKNGVKIKSDFLCENIASTSG